MTKLMINIPCKEGGLRKMMHCQTAERKILGKLVQEMMDLDWIRACVPRIYKHNNLRYLLANLSSMSHTVRVK